MPTHPPGRQHSNIASSEFRSLGERYRSRSALADALVDDMVGCYADWRSTAAAVGDAYQDWSTAPPTEQQARFSVYLSALDREQAAAAAYAEAVDDATRCLAGGAPS